MSNSIPNEHTTVPFEHIALAFSGGGFRAASFALGVLSYLNEVELNNSIGNTSRKILDNVTYLSSASGGSITTLLYTLDRTNNKSFNEFYKHLLEILDGSNLLEDALEELSNKSNWPKINPKKRSLINAFARTYDKYIFKGATLGNLYTHNPDCNIEEICLNATEFYRGLLFRQAIKLKNDSLPDEDFVYGNYIINVNKNILHKIKLGDVLAASSCFPAGFEPIIFPNDFADNNDVRLELLHALTIQPQEISKTELTYLYGKEADEIDINNYASITALQQVLLSKKLRDDFSFGLMDGGIADNQGLESLMRANERREKDETIFKPFDLMLINDVSSHYMDPLEPNEAYNNKGLSVNKLMLVMSVSLTAIIAIVLWLQLYKELLLAILITIPVFLLGAGLYIFLKIKGNLSNPNKYGVGLKLHKLFSRKVINLLLKYFSKTPISAIKAMLGERGKSMLSLNNDVFLKRVRQLLYQRFFSTNAWKFRKKSNHIYDLSFTNDLNRLKNDKDAYPPSIAMQIVAEEAYQMATTLWFDKKDVQAQTKASVIACGQFTTCYNLLLYTDTLIQNKQVYENINHALLINAVKKQLIMHYDNFINDPFWLYNKKGQELYASQWQNIVPKESAIPDQFKKLRK